MDKATRILAIPLTSASYPESMDDLLDTISFHWRDSMYRSIDLDLDWFNIQIFNIEKFKFKLASYNLTSISHAYGAHPMHFCGWSESW